MRIESAVTSITWIPSEAISGMPKLPFEAGIAHYDEPPPDRLADLDELHRRDAFREASSKRSRDWDRLFRSHDAVHRAFVEPLAGPRLIALLEALRPAALAGDLRRSGA